MKVSNYLDSEPVQEISGVVKREVITTDDGAPHFCMRVFEVESGSSTPSHSHPFALFVSSCYNNLKARYLGY